METGHGGPANTIMEQFYGHFDSLALAATKSNAILERLTAATNTQYIKIAKLHGKLVTNSPNAAAVTSITHTRHTYTTNILTPRTPTLP